MEESKKKPILIGVIIVCFAAAGVITFMTRSSRSPGLEALEGQVQWVKCANESCGAAYEMDRKEYYEELAKEAEINPDAPRPLPLTCKECGQKSVFGATKCEECGEVFFPGVAGEDKRADTCPKCGYSPTGEKKRQRRGGR